MAININIKGIQQFEQSVQNLTAALLRAETSMNNMVKSGTTIDRMFGGMVQFKEFMGLLNNLNKQGLQGLKALTTGMRDLAKALGDLPATGPSDRFFTSMKELLRLLTSASVPAGGGLAVTQVLKDFIKNIGVINAIAAKQGNNRGSENMALFIKDFVQMMTSVTQLMQKGSRLSDFDTLAKGIARFGAGLKKIMIELEDAGSRTGRGNKSFASMMKFVTTLGLLMRSLPAVVGKGSKAGSNLDELSFIIDRLGRGFSGLSKVKDTSIRQAIRIVGFLGTLAVGLRGIGRLSGDMKNAEGFSHVISSVFNAIERVSRLTIEEGRFGRMVFTIERPLKQLIRTIMPMLRQISNIKTKPGQLDGVARTLQALGLFFERMDNVKLDRGNFKDFRGIARDLAVGLNELGRVKVKASQLVAIGNALEGMAKSGIGLKQLRGAFERTGFNLGNEIKRGIILAAFNQFFHRLFMGAFRQSAITSEAKGLGDRIGGAIKSGLDFTVSVIRGLREIGDNLRDLGERFTRFGMDLMNRFGFGGLMQSEAFKAATGFEALSSQLAVFGGLTEEQVAQAQELAKQIGIDYPLSSNEALAATLDLIKAGQDLSQVEFILPAAADLAALSDSGSIEAVTQTLINSAGAFEQFREGVAGDFENVAVAADILAAGADVSTASVDSLGEGLANVATAASMAGLTMEETVAAMAQFEDRGIRGAEAGTALRSAINSLTRPQARQELERLGVEMYDQEGNFLGLDSIIKGMNDSYEELGYTQEQITQSLSRVADTYGRTGIQILLANDGISGTVEAMNGLGTAAERAQALLNNFEGDMVQLQGTMETLSTEIIRPMLARAFRPLVQALRGVVTAILEADPAVLDFISNFILVGSAIATVVGAIMVVVGSIIYFGGIIASATSAILAFALAPGLAVAALAGLAASLAVLVTVGTIVVGALALITAGISELFSLIENNVGGAGAALQNLRDSFGELGGTLSTTISLLRETISAFMGVSGEADRLERGRGLANFFSGINRQIEAVNRKAEQFNTITKGFNAFNENLGNIMRGAAWSSRGRVREITMPGMYTEEDMALMTGALRNYSEEYRATLEEVGRTPLMRAILGKEGRDMATAEEVAEFFTEVRTVVDQAVKGFQDTTGGILGMMFNQEGAREQFEAGLSSLFDLAATAIQSQTDLNLADAITKFEAGDLQGGVQSFVSTLMTSLRETILNNRELISGLLVDLLTFLLPGKIISPIANLLGLENLAGVVDGVFAGIRLAFENLVGTVFDLLEGKSLDEALLGNFGPGVRPVIRLIKALGGALDGLVGILRGVFEALFPSGGESAGNFLTVAIDSIANVFEGFTSGILVPLQSGANLFELLGGAIGSVFRGIVAGLPGAIASLSMFIRDLVTGVGTGIQELKLGEKIGDLFGGAASAFTGLDLGGKIGDLARGIADKVSEAISRIPEFITTLGTVLGSDILTKFGNDLQSEGGFTVAISNLASNLGNLVMDAVRQVPGIVMQAAAEIARIGNSLFGGIFERLFPSPAKDPLWDVPFVDPLQQAMADWQPSTDQQTTNLATQIQATIENAINQAFANIREGLMRDAFSALIVLSLEAGDYATATLAVKDRLQTIITNAVALLPTNLIDLGDKLGIQQLVDLGNSMNSLNIIAASYGWTNIATAIGNIATYPLEVISSLFNAIQELASGDSVNLFALAAAVLAFKGLSNPMQIGAMFTAIKGALVGFFGPVAILIALENFAQTIDALDFSSPTAFFSSLPGWLLELGANITEDVLGLVGIKVSADQLVADIKDMFDQLVYIATIGAREFGKALRNQFEQLDLELRMINDRLEIEAGRVLGQGVFSDMYYNTEDALRTGTGIETLRIAIGGVQHADEDGNPLTPEAMARLIAYNYNNLIAQAIPLVGPNLETLSDDDVRTIFETFLVAGKLDEALVDLPGAADFLTRMFRIDPQIAEDIDWEPIVRGLVDGAATEVELQQAINLLDVLIGQDTEMSQGDKTRARAALERTLTELQVIFDQAVATNPVDVNVATDVTVDEEQIVADADAAIEDALTSGGAGGKYVRTQAKIIPDVEVVGDETIDETESVTKLGNITAAADDAKDKFSELGTSTQTMSREVSFNATLAAVSWAAQSLLMMGSSALARDSVKDVADSVKSVSTEATNTQTTLATTVPQMVAGFSTLYNQSLLPLNALILKLNDVETAARNAFTNVLNVIPGFGGGDINAPGRADGGTVKAGRLYEVIEDGVGELLEMNNRTYLIPAGDGRIVPLNRSMSPPTPSLNNNSYYGGNTSSFVYQEAPVSVNVQVPAGMNVQEVGRVVERAINNARSGNQIRAKRLLIQKGKI